MYIYIYIYIYICVEVAASGVGRVVRVTWLELDG